MNCPLFSCVTKTGVWVRLVCGYEATTSTASIIVDQASLEQVFDSSLIVDFDMNIDIHVGAQVDSSQLIQTFINFLSGAVSDFAIFDRVPSMAEIEEGITEIEIGVKFLMIFT